jgi:hypothetical protein
LSQSLPPWTFWRDQPRNWRASDGLVRVGGEELPALEALLERDVDRWATGQESSALGQGLGERAMEQLAALVADLDAGRERIGRRELAADRRMSPDNDRMGGAHVERLLAQRRLPVRCHVMRWVTGPGAMGTARGEKNRRDRARSGVLERTRPIGTSRVERPPREAATARRGVVRSVLLRVFELGSRLQGVLRHSWQDDLVHLLLELRHRHRDIVLAHSQKPADADNGVRQ